jgi:hypothetical protein
MEDVLNCSTSSGLQRTPHGATIATKTDLGFGSYWPVAQAISENVAFVAPLRERFRGSEEDLQGAVEEIAVLANRFGVREVPNTLKKRRVATEVP